MISILFVCHGNICRSPALQGFLQKLLDDSGKAEKYYVDSCGLHSCFSGQEPDIRTKRAAQKKKVTLSHKAREFRQEDFHIFDYIFVATKEIKHTLYSIAPDENSRKKIHLATHFSRLYQDEDLEDPYYGGEEGFNHMMIIVEESVKTCLDSIERSRF